MASVKRRPRSRFWIACYRMPDGTRCQRTTKTTEKTTALQIALAAEKAARQQMTAEAARKLLAGILESIHEDARGLDQEAASAFFVRWEARRRREVGAGTAERYKRALADFATFAGSAVLSAPLANVSHALLARYRDDLSSRYATSTANLHLKILRAAFAEAAREGVISSDPVAKVRPLKKSREDAIPRRALKPAELRRILNAVPTNEEWHGMILAGIYTGQRLGDVALMQWGDVSRGWWRFAARKTGAMMAVPLAKPLAAWLRGNGLRLESETVNVFPRAAARVASAHGKTGTLSNQFHAILVRAGLVPARSHGSTGKGRSARRAASALSFHYLRHTTNTLLKASGAPESVAMAILGHESRAVSQVYTHMPEKSLQEAIGKIRV